MRLLLVLLAILCLASCGDDETVAPSATTIDPLIEVVTIEGRDQLNGWGGQTVDVRLTDDG